jgi:hypothetical protein
MLTVTIPFDKASVLDMRADTAWLGNASIGLVAAPLVPTPATTLANITEANFSGYKRQAAGVASVPFVDPNGVISLEGPSLLWQPTDTVTVNTIYGLFWTGSPSTSLMGVEMFDSPIPLPDTLHALTIVPRIGLDQNASYGSSLVSN